MNTINRQEQYNRLLKSSLEARDIREGLLNNALEQKKTNLYSFFESKPLNYFIVNYVYKTKQDNIFKKFKEWKKEGATVKKGEKAFPVWGLPVGVQKVKEALKNGKNYEPTPEEKEKFPMCYIFSNNQVSFNENQKGG